MLEIQLFGRLRLTPRAGPVALTLRPRAQRLLVFLLLNRHQPAYRDRLAFSLWPDLPEKDAQATFRRALSEVRTALPQPPAGDWITLHQDEVRWNLAAPHHLDVAEFEAGIRAGTVAGLQRAVAVYAGDLLIEFDEPWVDVEREQFREMQFTALRKLAAHRRAVGDHAGVLAFARQALLLEPLGEPVYRDLMLALYAGGDRPAALAEYDRLSQRLQDELGVEPMPETQQLRAQIVSGQVALASPASSAPEHPPAPHLTGRQPELDMLSAAWDGARAGRGRCLIVSGEAGVGKTHLTQHLTALVARQGGLALVGHCYEFENALPYEAVAEMLRAAAGALRKLDLPAVLRASLARLAPGLGADLPPLPVSAPDESRVQLFESLAQAFLSLAAQQPVLLLFEDVHWAAESTLDWLTYLAPRLGASQLLVVITHRSGETGAERALTQLRQRFGRQGAVATLLLKPLSPEAYHALVAQRSGLPAPQVARLAGWLFAETGGNPFFLNELIQGLIETRQIVVDAGRWTGPFADPGSAPQVALPDSLRETIAARVERLSELERSLLQVAAVSGRVFDYRVIRAAGGWPDELALAAMDQLLARELVRETEAADGFVFAHHLVQEALYAGLATPRRHFWHRRLITAIQHINPWDYAALARHALVVGERGLAAENARLAAQQFSRVYAYDEAIEQLRTALDLLDSRAPPQLRLEVLEALGDNHRRLRQGLPAIASYQAALELRDSLAQSEDLLAVRLHRKIYQMTFSMWETVAADQFDRAALVTEGLRSRLPALLAFVQREPPHPEFVAFLCALASDALVVRRPPDLDSARHHCHAASALAERLESPVALASALFASSAVSGAFGLLRERLDAALQALALTRDPRFDDDHERIVAQIGAASALISLGRFAQAIPYIVEAEQLADQVRAFDLQTRALSHLVYCHFRLDRWDEMLAAEARRRELQRLYQLERLGAPCFSIGLVGAVHGLLGDPQQSAACQAESAEIMSLVTGPLERWGRSQHF